MKIDVGFITLLTGHDLGRMKETPDVIFIMDREFVLRAFNPAWEAFALSNNGDSTLKRYGLGSLVPAAFPAFLRGYYTGLYNKVLVSGKRVDLEYECSSDNVYRKFHQSLYPLKDGAGVVVSNHLVVEKPQQETPSEFAGRHRNKEGIIVQCCHCRRTKDPSQPDKWDWIPDFVREIPEKTSHGFCSRCLEFYYPGLSETLPKMD